MRTPEAVGVRSTPSEEGRLPSLSRSPSTRVRILGWYIALLALALVIGLVLQRSILLAQVDDEVNAQLRQEVGELEQLSGGRNPSTGEPFGSDVRAIFDTFLSRNIPVEGEALFTLVDGRPHASTTAPVQLLSDPDLVARWAALTDTEQDETDTDVGRVRYLAVPVQAEGGTPGVFVVAIFLQEQLAEVDRVVRTGILVFGSTLLVASAAAWFVTGRVLRPIGQLTDTARTIRDDNWSERIPVAGDDEIAELARTFNEMLDRLEDEFDTQRRFIDDAGHELRTPITIIRGHLELLSDDPTEREETMRLVMDELDRMGRMVEDLLLLARAQQPDFLDIHPVDVAELTEDVAAKAAAFSDHDWQLEEVAEAVVDADPQRITQALMNLARNAAEHSGGPAPIRLGSHIDAGEVRFWVSDQGEGIAEADRERIFERFARGRNGRRPSEGAGLGLAIVAAIAEAHGGRVELASEPGAGSTFSLVMPLEGHPEHPFDDPWGAP